MPVEAKDGLRIVLTSSDELNDPFNNQTEWPRLSCSQANQLSLEFGDLIIADGNIGIGTATPAQKLEVNGAIAATALSVTDTVTANAFQGDGSALTGKVSTAGDTMTGPLTINAALNVNGAIASSSLSVTGNSSIGGDLTVSGNLEVKGNDLRVNGTTSTQILRVGASVSSHENSDGAIYRKGGEVYITVNDKLYIRDSGGTDDNIKMHFNTNSGRVGIGTTNPAEKLHIEGTGAVRALLKSSGDRAYWKAENSTKAYGVGVVDSSFRVWDYNANTYRVLIRANGVFNLRHANGSRATWDGGNNWDFTSDRSIKTDIEKENDILGRLMKLDVKNYRKKDNLDAPTKEIGFIAQDVKPLFPSLVGEVCDSDLDKPTLTLGYSTFGVLAVGGLKELKLEKDAEIAQLKCEINELKTQIQQLSNMVLDKLGQRVAIPM